MFLIFSPCKLWLFYWIVSLWLLLPFLLIFLLLFNFFVVFQGNFLALVILSLLLGFSFIDVFQNWVQIGYVLLSHVSCYYTGILLLITILSSHLANNSHNITKMLWLLDWFILFDYQFEDDMPLIMSSSFPMLLLGLP